MSDVFVYIFRNRPQEFSITPDLSITLPEIKIKWRTICFSLITQSVKTFMSFTNINPDKFIRMVVHIRIIIMEPLQFKECFTC